MEYQKDPLVSLTLPNTAAPNDAALILAGGDLPACMQAQYSSAILFRPKNSQTGDILTDGVYFFEAQRKNTAVITQQVDFGLLLYDPNVPGGYCDYNVLQQYESLNFGPNQLATIRFGPIASLGTLPFQGGSIVRMTYDLTVRTYTAGIASYDGEQIAYDLNTSIENREASQVIVGDVSTGTNQDGYIPYGPQYKPATGILSIPAAVTQVPGTLITITVLRTTDKILCFGSFDL